MDLDELELWKCLLTSVAIGLITALGAQFIYLPYVKKQIKNKYEVDKDEDNLKIDDPENWVLEHKVIMKQ